jgi:hypothetical protein
MTYPDEQTLRRFWDDMARASAYSCDRRIPCTCGDVTDLIEYWWPKVRLHAKDNLKMSIRSHCD